MATPLSILFNKSLESGSIPEDWKSADVIVIFKKGTKSDPGNYRSVSLTCVTSKLLESFIQDTGETHDRQWIVFCVPAWFPKTEIMYYAATSSYEGFN